MNVKEYAKLYEPICYKADEVDENLYETYGVKRGLRDKNGKGVLTGVTNISKIVSSPYPPGAKMGRKCSATASCGTAATT